ncbi:MAG: type IV toxin-antitoxin system AbiEi family antitoxin domain-containing protein [Halanaeroarchaeum sp.]
MDDFVTWARQRPLFTVNEAARATDITRPSLREKLSRLARRGDLIRVERGKYTAHEDPLIFATYIETPSFISLWSGLRYYDVTTQQPNTVQVIVPDGRTDLETVEFYSSSDMFGFGKRRYRDFDIFVADEERLVLDCLARKAVPVSELSELITMIDIDTATDYAERLGRNAVKKRLGYLLEEIRGTVVADLRPQDRNYPVLDLTGPRNGETDPRWRLTVNTDVIES